MRALRRDEGSHEAEIDLRLSELERVVSEAEETELIEAPERDASAFQFSRGGLFGG